MIEQILVLALEFSIRTVFLVVALWAMIKFQGLEWNFLGLLGSAALGSSLDMIPFVGHYLAVPALWLCLKKATNGDLFPDIAFTVAIGYALVFCMNLFVLGALMGDLRPSQRPSHKHAVKAPPALDAGSDDEPAPATSAASAASTASAASVAPVTSTAPVASAAPAEPPKNNEPTPVVAARAPDPVPAPQPSNAPAVAVKSTREIIRNFSVQGIIEGIDKPVGTINSGLKIYSLMAGETRSMETKDGRIVVRFDGVRDHQALLTISGEQFALTY